MRLGGMSAARLLAAAGGSLVLASLALK